MRLNLVYSMWAVALLIIFGQGQSAQVNAAPTVIYSTGFELAEGYDPAFTLEGQNHWTGYGSGGNGIVTNFFEGFGQQAYIGFWPPEEPSSFYTVYRPINLAPIPPAQPLVKFSVLMEITDSSSINGPWDDFRWSVYNAEGERLFSLDFDNSALLINYALDDGRNFVSTDLGFDNDGYYELVITMNFARNLWSASLNDVVAVHAQPMTTIGSALNLGDIAAVWSFRDPQAPGDNFMIFDEYTITAEAVDAIPPRIEALGLTAEGAYQARVYGEPGFAYRIEASSDLRQWNPLLTFTAPPNGLLDFQDPGAREFQHRFYRVRQSP
jgi:hypothetical protein